MELTMENYPIFIWAYRISNLIYFFSKILIFSDINERHKIIKSELAKCLVPEHLRIE